MRLLRASRMAIMAIMAIMAGHLALAAAPWRSTAAAGDALTGAARIIDGDTIAIRASESGAGGETRIRLWGLDAAEIDTAEGRQAARYLGWLIEGREVRCAPTGARSYDRIVARCFVAGADLAALLIELGAATPWCRYAGGFYDDAARRAGLETCE